SRQHFREFGLEIGVRSDAWPSPMEIVGDNIGKQSVSSVSTMEFCWHSDRFSLDRSEPNPCGPRLERIGRQACSNPTRILETLRFRQSRNAAEDPDHLELLEHRHCHTRSALLDPQHHSQVPIRHLCFLLCEPNTFSTDTACLAHSQRILRASRRDHRRLIGYFRCPRKSPCKC